MPGFVHPQGEPVNWPVVSAGAGTVPRETTKVDTLSGYRQLVSIEIIDDSWHIVRMKTKPQNYRTVLLTLLLLLVAISPLSAAPLHSYTNLFGMTFYRIPAGDFIMGSPVDEPGRGDDEGLRPVRITKDFYMQQTEVTQEQWKQVMGENPSHFKQCGGTCPVESVSWKTVQLFIFELSQRDPQGGYRLPTEAEWEYASRAGSQTAFFHGGISNEDCGYDPIHDPVGWYSGNSGGTPHPVAQKMANPWGLYDMHGNVWEWCQDYYTKLEKTDVLQVDPQGPSFAFGRVFKGGSWGFVAHCSRSANRKWLIGKTESKNLGFRLVYVPTGSRP